MWGFNFDEKEKHTPWLFLSVLIGKIGGPDVEVEDCVSVGKKTTELASWAWEQMSRLASA